MLSSSVYISVALAACTVIWQVGELWCSVTQQVGCIDPQGGAAFWAGLPGWQGPLPETSLVPVPSRWPQRGTRDTGPTSSSQTEAQRSKWPVNISYKHSHSSQSEETDRTESSAWECVCMSAWRDRRVGVCLSGRNQRHFDEIWIVFPVVFTLRGASQFDSLCIVISNHTLVKGEDLDTVAGRNVKNWWTKKWSVIFKIRIIKAPHPYHHRHHHHCTHAHRHTRTSPITLSTRSFLKPLLYLVSVTCALIAHNPCTDQWRLCCLLVGNCPLHQYSVCAGSTAASPEVFLMSLMCD